MIASHSRCFPSDFLCSNLGTVAMMDIADVFVVRCLGIGINRRRRAKLSRKSPVLFSSMTHCKARILPRSILIVEP